MDVPHSSPEITAKPSSFETKKHIDPVPNVPPNQEWQSANPWQHGQERTGDNPPSRGVSQRSALEGKVGAEQQEFTATPATTIDEILKAAYFVATGIDAPTVEVVNPHVINMHFPADGSLATIKVEARGGAWGGIGPKGSPEEDTDRNAHYEEMKAAAAPPEPPPEGEATRRGESRGKEEERGDVAGRGEATRGKSKEDLARQEAHDDAHAREEAKPQEPRKEDKDEHKHGKKNH